MYNSYIYLMACENNKSVLKIGISTNPKKRASVLNCEYRHTRKYKVLATVEFTTYNGKSARALEALTQTNFLFYNGVKDDEASLDHFIVDARRNKEKLIPLFKKAVSISASTMTALGTLATLQG